MTAAYDRPKLLANSDQTPAQPVYLYPRPIGLVVPWWIVTCGAVIILSGAGLAGYRYGSGGHTGPQPPIPAEIAQLPERITAMQADSAQNTAAMSAEIERLKAANSELKKKADIVCTTPKQNGATRLVPC